MCFNSTIFYLFLDLFMIICPTHINILLSNNIYFSNDCFLPLRLFSMTVKIINQSGIFNIVI